MNQYWYSENTIKLIVEEVTMHATKCALLSAPSIFFALGPKLRATSKVFEFDRQWQADPGFVFYDFNKPDQIPIHMFGEFDYVVVDPPFITREVWTKYMETVKILLAPNGKVLFSSILENHGMLEELTDAPLMVPLYRPSIPHLTYQYHLFLNYPNSCLDVENSELPEEDKKTRAALRMANDLRESEKAFTQQMVTRNRDGEEPLPAIAHAKEGGYGAASKLSSSMATPLRRGTTAARRQRPTAS